MEAQLNALKQVYRAEGIRQFEHYIVTTQTCSWNIIDLERTKAPASQIIEIYFSTNKRP